MNGARRGLALLAAASLWLAASPLHAQNTAYKCRRAAVPPISRSVHRRPPAGPGGAAQDGQGEASRRRTAPRSRAAPRCRRDDRAECKALDATLAQQESALKAKGDAATLDDEMPLVLHARSATANCAADAAPKAENRGASAVRSAARACTPHASASASAPPAPARRRPRGPRRASPRPPPAPARCSSRTADSPLCRWVQRRACALPAVVDEAHFAGLGVLRLAAEAQIALAAAGVAHLQRAGDVRQVDHGHRDGEGHRDRVAHVDQRVDARQGAFLAQAPQQRFGGAAVLRWLEPHARERAAPSLHFGQVRLAAGRGQPRPCRRFVRAGPALRRRRRGGCRSRAARLRQVPGIAARGRDGG